MIRLTELLDESDASDEAAKLRLDYMSFGRWGKDGKVTHNTVKGKLEPVQPTRFNTSNIAQKPEVVEPTYVEIRGDNERDFGGKQGAEALKLYGGNTHMVTDKGVILAFSDERNAHNFITSMKKIGVSAYTTTM